MSSRSGLAMTLVGIAFLLLGSFILFGGGVSLPTRQPPSQFHFSGLSLLLLGMSPVVAGLLCIALARGAITRNSPATQLAIGLVLGCLGLAFVLVPKG